MPLVDAAPSPVPHSPGHEGGERPSLDEQAPHERHAEDRCAQGEVPKGLRRGVGQQQREPAAQRHPDARGTAGDGGPAGATARGRAGRRSGIVGREAIGPVRGYSAGGDWGPRPRRPDSTESKRLPPVRTAPMISASWASAGGRTEKDDGDNAATLCGGRWLLDWVAGCERGSVLGVAPREGNGPRFARHRLLDAAQQGVVER